MAAAESQRRQCATYTRKSSEEGLEQDFNSLDAQREACEAYIRSQTGEGWRLVPTRYDDGGYSGGTLDRPAVEQLLADIDAEKIDTIVVYKVDRLTRSLADVAKIVEVMDAHAVSFVSVTQPINTTTTMGRLTLNMLLSFAQFEREVTGERIRDKLAASKRKGLWMGGHVPLGYAPDGRTLTILDAEAKTIRTLFRLYLELGSVRRVKEAADSLGLMTKIRPDADRRMRGGRPLSRGHLYHLLSNPIYAGRIPHRGDSFEGQHPAIIDRETWDAVQKQLAAQAPNRPARANTSTRSPLRGKLFDETGALLTPSHAVKSGRRYRYYVSRNPTPRTDANAATDRSRNWRLPAREIERLVGEAVRALFADRTELARLAREAQIRKSLIPGLIEDVQRWNGRPLEVVRRVDLGTEEMAVHVNLSRFLDKEGAVIRHVIPVCIRRRGVEMRLALHGGEQGSGDGRVDPALVKAIVRGRKWFEDLASGRVGSLLEIAEAEGVSDRYVGHLIPMAFLAPDIVARILSGTQPVDLTTEALTKRIDLPVGWAEQRAMLGFD
jgi:site-specific DNA recombinase